MRTHKSLCSRVSSSKHCFGASNTRGCTQHLGTSHVLLDYVLTLCIHTYCFPSVSLMPLTVTHTLFIQTRSTLYRRRDFIFFSYTCFLVMQETSRSLEGFLLGTMVKTHSYRLSTHPATPVFEWEKFTSVPYDG